MGSLGDGWLGKLEPKNMDASASTSTQNLPVLLGVQVAQAVRGADAVLCVTQLVGESGVKPVAPSISGRQL